MREGGRRRRHGKEEEEKEEEESGSKKNLGKCCAPSRLSFIIFPPPLRAEPEQSLQLNHTDGISSKGNDKNWAEMSRTTRRAEKKSRFLYTINFGILSFFKKDGRVFLLLSVFYQIPQSNFYSFLFEKEFWFSLGRRRRSSAMLTNQHATPHVLGWGKKGARQSGKSDSSPTKTQDAKERNQQRQDLFPFFDLNRNKSRNAKVLLLSRLLFGVFSFSFQCQP